MNDWREQENKRINKLIMEAQIKQTKRTMKTFLVLFVLFFAIEGALAIYRFFF